MRQQKTDNLLNLGTLLALYQPKPTVNIHQSEDRLRLVGQISNVQGHDSLVSLLNIWMLKCHRASNA